MDTGSFTVYVKAHDIHKGIAEDFEIRFDTSSFELDKLLPKEKKKVIEIIKDKLGEQITKEFVVL